MQRKAISDHLKKNTESHLKLACERLQQLQDSTTLSTASIQEVQTEMVTAMTKIKELSEAVLNSEGQQDSLCDKIAAINKKLPKFQSRDDVTDGRLSGLKADVVTMKTEVKDLTEELSSTDGTLFAVQDDITELQKLIPKVDSLQGLRGEVVGAVNMEIQKLQESTVTRLEKRDRIVLDEIESLQSDIVTIKTEAEELTEELSSTDETLSEVQDDITELKKLIPRVDSLQGLRGEVVGAVNMELQKLQEAITRLEKRDRIMMDKIESIEWSFEAQLQGLRDNSARDMKKQNRTMLDKIESIEWSFETQLRDLRDNSTRGKKLLDQFRSEQETLKDFLLFLIFGVAILVLCVRYGIFTDMYSRILSILKK